MADYLNIAGRIRTTASDGVAMEAQEVKDLNLNKSQQEVNADVQTELGDRYTKEETYNREELNELITTPDVNRVYVIATNLTTAVTDLLPATGSSDTLYNVGNWDGTQYDTTVYSIYGWDGTAYVCLAVRSSIGEVYDISANHPDGQGNPTPYANLTAAIGTNGANIPADIRRGGMSIKFVSSVDNKYVQFRYMGTSTAAADFTNVANWQGVDKEPVAESENMVTSGGMDNTFIQSLLKFSSERVTIQASSFTINGLLKHDGTLDTSVSDYHSTDYIEIGDNDVLIYGYRIFPYTRTWTGCVLFDENYNVIDYSRLPKTASQITTGYINISKYKNVKYVRFSKSSSISNTYCNILFCEQLKLLLSQLGMFVDLTRQIQSSEKIITRREYNGTQGCVDNQGNIDTGQDNYYTTDYIEVNPNTKILGSSSAVIAVYDSNKIHIVTLNNNDSGGRLAYSQRVVQNITNTDLTDYSNARYVRCSIQEAASAYAIISTPNDRVVDYTVENKIYADKLGYITDSGYALSNRGCNFSTPLIRVKEGEIWAFNGRYENYHTVPAVYGWSDNNFSNPVVLVKKDGDLRDFVFEIPSGVNYIAGWGERAKIDNSLLNNPTYLEKKKDGITITVKKNGGMQVNTNSLLHGIIMATKGFDNTVFVEEGVYDLIQEFKDYYGNDFFENYTSSSIKGILLKNRVKVIFSSGAKVICEYDGNNQAVQHSFAPFNSAEYGFTLENATIVSKRVRYSVHDERGSSTDSYRNVYKNCSMYHDKDNGDGYDACLGGGLGKHGEVIILNSVFESNTPDDGEPRSIVSYHNNVAGNSKSNIVFNSNVVKGINTFRLSWYGESEDISTCYASNNSLGSAIIHRRETSSATIRNTELIEWNNVVRT